MMTKKPLPIVIELDLLKAEIRCIAQWYMEDIGIAKC
jgi:hypothetical protein